MQIKHFDESDWDCFAGCENSFPFITAEDITVIDSKREWGGCAVIDGPYVQIFLIFEPNTNEERQWNQEYDELTLHKKFDSVEEAITYILKSDSKRLMENLSVDGFDRI